MAHSLRRLTVSNKEHDISTADETAQNYQPLDYGFYLMDCLEGMRRFPDGYFDLAIVDVPYGSKVGKGGYMHNTISGGVAKRRKYHLALWNMERPDKEYFDELMRVSKNQIIWGGNYICDLVETSQCWIVWDKCIPEGVMYADCELAWTSFDRATKKFTYQWSGMLQGDMKHKEYRIHPTQKPVALYEWILNNFANEGDTILDTHVGSASSLIACHNTNHKYVGFEIDPEYYRQAKKRLDQETAQMNIFDFLR